MKSQLSQSSLLKHQSYIDGKWADTKSGQTFSVTNLANGEHIIDMADLDAEEATLAVEAAERTHKSW